MTQETLMAEAIETQNRNASESVAPITMAEVADALYEGSENNVDGESRQTTDAANTAGPEGEETREKPEAKADETKKDEDRNEEPYRGAPESYEFAAKDGVEYSAEVLSVFSEVAKEIDLSQEAAQKLIDKVVPAIQERHVAQIKALADQWRADSETDPEFGGEKLQENLAFVARAMTQFGSPELKPLLNGALLGDHPEIIRFFYRVGKAVSEDAFVGRSVGEPKKAGPKTFSEMAEAIYSKKN
jgi:hypothetical protein